MVGIGLSAMLRQSHSGVMAEQEEEMDSGGYLTRIPLIAAASPRKVDGEAAKEVEEGPGQDDDVVNVEKDDDHLGGVADAWRGGGAKRGWRQCTDFPYTTHPCLGERSRATPSVLKHEGLGPRLLAPSSPSPAAGACFLLPQPCPRREEGTFLPASCCLIQTSCALSPLSGSESLLTQSYFKMCETNSEIPIVNVPGISLIYF